MIILFGAPGAGKSKQGQILAEANGWTWFSSGQLLRDSSDPEIHKIMLSGQLVSDDHMNKVVQDALEQTSAKQRIVLDGYPRRAEQADWLITLLSQLHRSVDAVIVLEVSDKELVRRLTARGRSDDTKKIIIARTKLYHEKTEPLLDHFTEKGITVKRIDGEGDIEAVHKRVVKAVEECIQK